MRGTVLVFVKAPRAGAVKTRLAADIGAGRAAALFRIMMDRTVAAATAGPWRTIACLDYGATPGGWRHLIPPRVERRRQGRGGLGARMKRAIDAAPPGPVIVIGADAPGLRAAHIASAFDALRGADAVFGPAVDGGYWLIGLARRRAAPALFDGVRWSTEYALEDTKRTLPSAFEIAKLETLADIDESRDLAHLGLRSTRPRAIEGENI